MRKPNHSNFEKSVVLRERISDIEAKGTDKDIVSETVNEVLA